MTLIVASSSSLVTADVAHADPALGNTLLKVFFSLKDPLLLLARPVPPHIRIRSPSLSTSIPRSPPLVFRPSPRLRIDACSKIDLGGAADTNLSILAGLECACHRGKLFFIN